MKGEVKEMSFWGLFSDVSYMGEVVEEVECEWNDALHFDADDIENTGSSKMASLGSTI